MSTTEPSLGWAYSTGMLFYFRVATAVGFCAKMAASPVVAIFDNLAEFGIYSSTLVPIVSGKLLKPGSTLCSSPPWIRLNIRNACRPKVDTDADWNTTLSLNFGSARSIQEVGAGQPFCSNSFLL